MCVQDVMSLPLVMPGYLTSECCASGAVTASALFASMLGGRCCAGTVEQYNAAAPGSLMSRMSLHQCVGLTLTSSHWPSQTLVVCSGNARWDESLVAPEWQ